MTMKKVYAVVHLKDLELTLENVGIAKEAGCDGCFLISHTSVSVWPTYQHVREKVPGFFLGVNDLSRGPMDVINFLFDTETRPDALWFDNAGFQEIVWTNPESGEARTVAQEVAISMAWDFKQTLSFGGVAFKGQPEVDDVCRAAQEAKEDLDVVVTSGPATGQPPTVEKIQRMSEGCGVEKLGIASGINPENVGDYLPYASHFLVSTGISKNFYELFFKRTKELVDRVRAYDGR
jgi:hypothetical protein